MEFRGHRGRPKRVHRDAVDLARKGDQSTTKRVPRGDHAVDARERIETLQLDLWFVWQALDGRGDVPELQVLGKKDAIALDRTAHRESRFEATNAAERSADTWHQIARLDLPFIGPSPRADLCHARRESPVFRGEGIGQDF